MAYKVTIQPTIEPFTHTYVKTWLKIPSSVTIDDALIDDLIISARSWAEHCTGRALMTQTIEEYFDGWPYGMIFNLSVAPIQTVSSISYMSSGSYVTWSASNYNVDTVSEPARIVPKLTANIPNYDLYTPNVIKVTYTAGATARTSIPMNIMQSMLQKIAFMYENREDIPLSGTNLPRQRSADALLMPQRLL